MRSRPTQQAPVLHDHLLQRLHVAQDAPHVREQPLAGLGQHDLAALPLDQLALQPVLHVHDLRRQCGLGDVDRRGRLAEVALPRKGVEIVHLPERYLHRFLLSIKFENAI